MTYKNIAQKVADQIQHNGIKPVSKWMFRLKNFAFWSLVVTFLLVGSVSLAIIIFLMVTNDWDLYSRLHAAFIFQTIPYFWVISFIVFIAFGEHYYRRTVLGHRQRLIKIIAVYFVVTGICGTALFLGGIGQKIEQLIAQNIPAYHLVMYDKNSIWSQPEKGLLAGTIKAVGNDTFVILDLQNHTWTVEKSNAFIRSRVNLAVGEKIKILGKKANQNLFIADEVRPWEGLGKKQMQ